MFYLFFSAIVFAQSCPPKIEIKIIRGDSMKGVYSNGQQVSADMNYYTCREPKVGDIVLIQKAGFSAPMVKQIYVGPKQSFSLKSKGKAAALVVDGRELRNPIGKIYLFSDKALKMLKLYEESFHGKMPDGTYFVFGTGLSPSKDSTRFGPVLRSEIIGKMLP